MGVEEIARKDALDAVKYTIKRDVETDSPLRRLFFTGADAVVRLFPLTSRKLLLSTYRNVFFSTVQDVLRGGPGTFWIYLNSLHEELAPLIVMFALFVYALGMLAFTYAVGAIPVEYALVSYVAYPSVVVSLVYIAYLLYLYSRYKRWLEKARKLFAPMLEEWRVLGYVAPPPEPSYTL